MGRPVRFDPHVHTVASFDSAAPVEQVVDCALEVGLHAIAVTDQDTLSGARRAMQYATSTPLTVVPGVEVSTAAGHLLALGVEACPAPSQPLPDTIERVRQDGGAAVIPHPFQRSRHGVSRAAITDCDGLEVHNAMAVTGLQNRRAREFAIAEGYPKLGGSDAHIAEFVGRAYTEVDLPASARTPSADSIVAAIRAGRTTFAGKRTSIGRYLRKTFQNVRLRTRNRFVLSRRSGDA